LVCGMAYKRTKLYESVAREKTCPRCYREVESSDQTTKNREKRRERSLEKGEGEQTPKEDEKREMGGGKGAKCSITREDWGRIGGGGVWVFSGRDSTR